jgi:uncharacterized protein (TIGR02246 family)
MNRGVSLLSALALASIAAVTSAQDPAAEEARIRGQLNGWVEAWNRGDAGAVAAFYAEDAVRTLPSGVVQNGRAQILGSYRHVFNAPLPKGVLRKLDMKVQSVSLLRPDVAVVDYQYRATGIPLLPDVEVTGRTTLVMEKQGGEWLRSVQSVWIPVTPDCYRRCDRD